MVKSALLTACIVVSSAGSVAYAPQAEAVMMQNGHDCRANGYEYWNVGNVTYWQYTNACAEIDNR